MDPDNFIATFPQEFPHTLNSYFPELIGITNEITYLPARHYRLVGKIILPEFQRAKRRRHTRFAAVIDQHVSPPRLVNVYGVRP
jgi:hypothetical protein